MALLRRSRTFAAAATFAGALASLAAAASCILADPPPDLPKPPRHHPIIVKGSVKPSYTKVLSTLPNFEVPVELIDPDTPFSWRVFIDYDPIAQTPPVQTGDEQPTPATIDGGIQYVDFNITDPAPDPSTCHVIELVVALGFNARSAHTPDSNGADSIVWFYSPTGEPNGCPHYDAGGADGAFPDAEADRIFVPEVGGQ